MRQAPSAVAAWPSCMALASAARTLLAQAESLEHLYRAAGDTVGLADLERTVATLDQPGADAGEIRKLGCQQRPRGTASDNEDVHRIGKARRSTFGVGRCRADVGVAGRVAVQMELHGARCAGQPTFIPR